MTAKERIFRPLGPPLRLFAICAVAIVGCDDKETVLEVEGPNGGGVEVERDRDTGEVDVNVDREREKVIDVDTPGADVEVTRDRRDGSVDVDAD